MSARSWAGLRWQVAGRRQPLAPPRLRSSPSGGEITVTVRGKGRGGRNVEFLAGYHAARPSGDRPAIAGDTDGVDGQGHPAGALALDTLDRAWRKRINPNEQSRR